MPANPLVQLEAAGQSVWYDQMRRALLTSGELKRMIEEDHLRGLTSNPTIFEKAIGGSSDYSEELRKLAGKGSSIEQIYQELVVEDIAAAADLFRAVYDRTGGIDGFASLEVSPDLAYKTKETVAEAKKLFRALNRQNVLIKIPATTEGIPAIEEAIAAGININVTLIFSREVYEQVAEAYIRGLERRLEKGEPVDKISSVASFFVSRIDTSVDNELTARIAQSTEPKERERLARLCGKIAIANARMAYQSYKKIFHGGRFAKLRAAGAKPQRQLWASTGTKNAKYSDVLYIEQLIGPETVNTIPPATYNAFKDHGKVQPTLESHIDEAQKDLADLESAGISLKQITEDLRKEGVQSFSDSFAKLMNVIEARRDQAMSAILERHTANLDNYEAGVKASLGKMEKDSFTARMWKKDAALWKGDAAHQAIIKNALGWMSVVEMVLEHAKELKKFAGEIQKAGFTHVVVLGMGGSSLCPEVLRRTFGKQAGHPELLVLDSTVPAAIRDLEKKIKVEKALFIVASKSGTTTEPQMFLQYFWERVKEKKKNPGENFIAITDPDTKLAKQAHDDHFRRIFLNPADIGGRYSALSFFGMVPFALMGGDFVKLLERAHHAMHACSAVVPTEENPGARLGAALGTLATQGRDKLTFITTKPIDSVGLWIEQLIAESTGKEGKGILPVAGEALGPPEVYGNDRIFVYLHTGKPDGAIEAKLAALEGAGHPVLRHRLHDAFDLGEEFFLWEFATAVAGQLLGIDPFDQPNVQESKDNTKRLLGEFQSKGALPEQQLLLSEADVSLYDQAPATFAPVRKGDSLASAIAAQMKQVKARDYVAITAYIEETPAHEQLIQQIRTAIRDRFKVATTTGYGPRFLHSTGQLHKGGGDNGVFLQITAKSEPDAKIPGEPFTFGLLKDAQSLGDFESLAQRKRRAMRIHFGKDIAGGLAKLLGIVQGIIASKTSAA
jgi:transaldolase/glucose-6-phosphate isomerase